MEDWKLEFSSPELIYEALNEARKDCAFLVEIANAETITPFQKHRMNELVIRHTPKLEKWLSLINDDNAHSVIAIGRKGEFFDCDYDDYFDADLDLKNYIPKYKFKLESDGWILREVKSGVGNVGHTKTVREQIIKSVLETGFEFEIEG